MSNVDINVDGRTEKWTPVSHTATSRCDKNDELAMREPAFRGVKSCETN